MIESVYALHFSGIQGRLVLFSRRSIGIDHATVGNNQSGRGRSFLALVVGSFAFLGQIGQYQGPVSLERQCRLDDIAVGSCDLHSVLLDRRFCRFGIKSPDKQTGTSIIGCKPSFPALACHDCRGVAVGCEQWSTRQRNGRLQERLPCFFQPILNVFQHGTNNGTKMCGIQRRRTTQQQNLDELLQILSTVAVFHGAKVVRISDDGHQLGIKLGNLGSIQHPLSGQQPQHLKHAVPHLVQPAAPARCQVHVPPVRSGYDAPGGPPLAKDPARFPIRLARQEGVVVRNGQGVPLDRIAQKSGLL
mmetsp:Transcript_14464/g.40269  ORF Transcript_14464/g.40269 Transcript_14464/m.40269 type:complete len:303 (+) Transcript_14464:717-1625(+)